MCFAYKVGIISFYSNRIKRLIRFTCFRTAHFEDGSNRYIVGYLPGSWEILRRFGAFQGKTTLQTGTHKFLLEFIKEL